MNIKKETLNWYKNSRQLLYSTLAFVLFAIIGQLVCDQLGTIRGSFLHLITIVLIAFEILVLYVIAGYLTKNGRATRILAWVMGVIACLYMIFMSGLFIFGSPNPVEVYGAGWWVGQVDKLEDEQRLWSLSHWIGQGEPYYEYDDAIVATPAEKEAEAMAEPYHSALDERVRAETVYQFYYSDTLLNVLSYSFGRWVWLIYLAIVVVWMVVGIRALSEVNKIPLKLLYLSSWLLFTAVVWLPALNTCGLKFSYYGPPFTGFSSAYWEFNLMMVGPPLAIMFFLLSEPERSKICCAVHENND